MDGRVVLSAMPDQSEVQVVQMDQVQGDRSLCYSYPDFDDLHFEFLLVQRLIGFDQIVFQGQLAQHGVEDTKTLYCFHG